MAAGLAKPGAQIIDLADDTFGRVLRLFSPIAPTNANHTLSIDPLHEGILVISFDVMTNTDFRSLYLLATPPDATASNMFDKTAVSMCWGATPGTVSHYAGRWIELARYELDRWHHVDVLIHLSGAKAGSLDVNVDGGPFDGEGLPWRNLFKVSPHQPIGRIWFIAYGRPESQQGGSTGRFVQIDNVVITHVPERDATADDAAAPTGG